MLHYCETAHGNFGDLLNPWLWSRLAPEVCAPDNPTLFLGIGTILDQSVPVEPLKVVFGSGCSPSPAPMIDSRWFIYGVRGPRTAAKLRLPDSLALGDPAILVRRVVETSVEKTHPVAFMPHHQSTREADWNALCQRAGMHFIDPHLSVEQVLAELQASELLLTEAMHGAIVADALRVPWVGVRLYPQFVEFKWRDWAEAMGIKLELASVPPIYQRPTFSTRNFVHGFKKSVAKLGVGKTKWLRYQAWPSTSREIEVSLRALKGLAANSRPSLSSDAIVEQRERRLFETLQNIREDWQRGQFNPPQR